MGGKAMNAVCLICPATIAASLIIWLVLAYYAPELPDPDGESL